MYEAQHIDRCRQKFGKSWTEVHRFLDQYFEDFGPSHRRILHHQRGIDLVVEKFGEKARGPAEQHILDDIRMFEPMASEIPEDWTWYGEPLLFPTVHKAKLIAKLNAVMKELYPNPLSSSAG